MIFAKRILKLAIEPVELPVVVTVSAPEKQAVDWSCHHEIAWPEDVWRGVAYGVDGLQALQLALEKIAAELYTSEPHRMGQLMWQSRGDGYGFPLLDVIGDLAVGADRRPARR